MEKLVGQMTMELYKKRRLELMIHLEMVHQPLRMAITAVKSTPKRIQRTRLQENFSAKMDAKIAQHLTI